uniref:Uncharacterized protein n=1 Tax=Plectus sambesii TaxID=2011161 RepID=A0A914WI21_9BILA
MNGIVLTVFAVVCLTAVVTAERQCYSGSGTEYSKQNCGSNANYCTKVTLAGIVTRGCDRTDIMCRNQGNKCANQGSAVGEVCCCDSDNCNSATITTTSFALGLVTLLAGLIASYVH